MEEEKKRDFENLTLGSLKIWKLWKARTRFGKSFCKSEKCLKCDGRIPWMGSSIYRLGASMRAIGSCFNGWI